MNAAPELAALREGAAQFRRLLVLARERLANGRYAQAAVVGQIAALYAAYDHHGDFIDAGFEETMKSLGAAALGAGGTPTARATSATRVLHVLTAAKEVGGDTRFVRRLIERDPGRAHSLALTNQMYFEVPGDMRAAVARSGGSVHVLDAGKVGAIERARALRALADGTDVVLLHVYVEDIVPLIAFFDASRGPPIVFVMQADHQFFAGLTTAQIVVHLRESGIQLSVARRGVDAQRLGFLPIPLEPVAKRGSREQAREQLGIAHDAVVMLTIARAAKYQPIGDPHFATATLPALERHPKAVLIAIGPRDGGAWADAHARTGGRVRAMGQRHDTTLFYEAADIYIDSFPFASNTSLLEAASYGLPLVTYFPYSAEADVLGAGAPGIDATLKRVHDLDEYTAALSALILDPGLRDRLGEQGRQQFIESHAGPGWHRLLDEILEKALRAAPGSLASDRVPRAQPGELDYLLSRLYRSPNALGAAIDRFAPELPHFQRVQLLLRLQRIDRAFSFGLFLPRRLNGLIGRYLHGWREWPLFRSLAGRNGKAGAPS
jgi:glycosyltransferase involved in cell wall biosynthesis